MPVVKSYYKVLRVTPDPEYFYIQNEYAGNNTFTLTKTGTPNSTDLEYSKDKTTWTDIHSGGTVSMAQGEKVYLRSTTGFSKDDYNRYQMNCNQNFSIGGKVATLFDYQNIDTFDTIPSCGLIYLYDLASKLISAANLDFSNITKINEKGLYSCFSRCSYLTTLPDLSSVTTIGNTGMAAFAQNCGFLTTPPDLSSVTTIGTNGLSNCFGGCASLTTPPDLSGVTSVSIRSLSSCFSGCSSLTSGPDLSGITNMTPNYYILSECFANCTSLNYVISPNVTVATNTNFNNWLNNVAASGVVKKPTNLTLPTDSTSGVPTGWTTQNY